jgi:hypothetical protein
MYIQSTLPTDDIVVNSSVTDLTSVELEIGGQRIDKQTGHWMECWAELTENKTGRAKGTNYQVMSGHGAGVASNTASAATDATNADAVFFTTADQASAITWLPLQFWFCRNPGLALPLIALQYHEVKLIMNHGTVTHSGHKVWADYIYLDTEERRRFAQVSHEYLIEQVQEQSLQTQTTNELNFNHPVKELVWTATGAAPGALNYAALASPLTALSDTCLLKLNGHDRFAARAGTYFSRTQVLQHHSGPGGLNAAISGVGSTNDAVCVYSFALKPEEHQPSGTCNFSRIDNAQLVTSQSCAANALMFAVNYNVLRVMSGMGGLAYSN